ncbi:MAG: hypothetical protein U9N61_08500 [Euryarchaeota archaeon]|nr:hypothetical protein [Euryarchaeota archaeon]
MRATDDITDYVLLPEGRMDGVIVVVVHDEFRGVGLLSGMREFLGAGAVVVDVMGWRDVGLGFACVDEPDFEGRFGNLMSNIFIRLNTICIHASEVVHIQDEG